MVGEGVIVIDSTASPMSSHTSGSLVTHYFARYFWRTYRYEKLLRDVLAAPVIPGFSAIEQ